MCLFLIYAAAVFSPPFHSFYSYVCVLYKWIETQNSMHKGDALGYLTHQSCHIYCVLCMKFFFIGFNQVLTSSTGKLQWELQQETILE